MKSYILTHRYAKAFMDLAVQNNVVDKCYDDMRLVRDAFAGNEELRNMIYQSFVSKEHKKNILMKLFGDKTEPITVNMLCLLIDKDREEIIASIYDAFYELYLEYKKIAVVTVTTAVALDEETTNRIVNILRHKIVDKDTIQIEKVIDKNIIGGFVVRYKDYEYDASVKNTLRRLQSSMSESNLFVKEY